MSKPKTKGRTYGVRIVVTLEPEMERRAAEKGLSPGRWIALQIERALEASSKGGQK